MGYQLLRPVVPRSFRTVRFPRRAAVRNQAGRDLGLLERDDASILGDAFPRLFHRLARAPADFLVCAGDWLPLATPHRNRTGNGSPPIALPRLAHEC